MTFILSPKMASFLVHNGAVVDKKLFHTPGLRANAGGIRTVDLVQMGATDLPEAARSATASSTGRLSRNRTVCSRLWRNRILGLGGTHGNLSLLGHIASPILPGQPLVLAFFPPVVCEPVMLSCALPRMAFERARSV